MDMLDEKRILDALARLPAKHRLAPEPPKGSPATTVRKARRSLLVTEEPISARPGDVESAGRMAAYRALENPLELSRRPEERTLEALKRLAPQAGKVLDDICVDLRFAKSVRAQRMPPHFILLWGDSGSGKTWIAKNLMHALAPASLFYSAAGISSAIDIVGQPASFRASDASLPVRAIARTQRANPGIIVDELDKAGTSDWNGDPILALLPFTEPESAAKFFDPFVQVHVDCSWVTWIFTANDIDRFPEPLLNRLRIYRIERPGPECLDVILEGFAADLAARHGLKPQRMPTVDDLLRLKLERLLVGRGSLRDLRALYEREIKQRSAIDKPVAQPIRTEAAVYLGVHINPA